MAETSTPPECPTTITVRRNPHRKARPTPTTATHATFTSAAHSSSSMKTVPNFPIEEILSMEMGKNSSPKPKRDQLQVFLRVKPLNVTQSIQGLSKSSNLKSSMLKNAWPKPKSAKERGNESGKVKKKNYSCVAANDSHSVSVSMPSDTNRVKSEIYNGFSHVFTEDSSQDEVYEKMMKPTVDEFINGRSGLLAALGPSGSGKTYTVFGTVREPGIVPRALRDIFRPAMGIHSGSPRLFYISMFEIYLEKGKTEKLLDLSPDGDEVYMQQSALKGLKEMLVTDCTQAESLIASGMLKRSTAMTNSNSHSSRSQCIINIRSATNVIDGEIDSQPRGAILTFVDLAGAEREKKTGNQGGRLLESNFINNTSMVFGLCLRSLLEHQKNPKKPLQKHFQNSLLTRYLRDYLEGKKRMALILTIRSGKEDYIETSFLLRQASPFMEIKFQNKEDTHNVPCSKRQGQTMFRSKLSKRPKLSGPDDSMDKEGDVPRDSHRNNSKVFLETGLVLDHFKEAEPSENKEYTCKETSTPDVKSKREYHVLQGFAKAIWNVLKQYKEKAKVLENEVDLLKANLKSEQTRYLELERELSDFKLQCSCYNHVCGEDGSAIVSESSVCSSEETSNIDAEISFAPVSVELGLTVSEYEPYGDTGRGSKCRAMVEYEEYELSKTGLSTKVFEHNHGSLYPDYEESKNTSHGEHQGHDLRRGTTELPASLCNQSGSAELLGHVSNSPEVNCAEFDESLRSFCYKPVQVEDASATIVSSTISSSQETTNDVVKTSGLSGSEECEVLHAAIPYSTISSSQDTTNVAKIIPMSGSDEPGIPPAAIFHSTISCPQETANVVAESNQTNVSGELRVSPAGISDSTISSTEETANIVARTSQMSVSEDPMSGSDEPGIPPAAIFHSTISCSQETANVVAESNQTNGSGELRVSPAGISDSTISSTEETANIVARTSQMSVSEDPEVSHAAISDFSISSSLEKAHVGANTVRMSGSDEPGNSFAAISHSTISSSQETANVIAKTIQMCGSDESGVSPIDYSNICSSQETKNIIAEAIWMTGSEEPELSLFGYKQCMNTSPDSKITAAMGSEKQYKTSDSGFRQIHEFICSNCEENERALKEDQQQDDSQFSKAEVPSSLQKCVSQCSNTEVSSLQTCVSNSSVCSQSCTEALLRHVSINLECTPVERLSSHEDVCDRKVLADEVSYLNRALVDCPDTVVTSNSQTDVKRGSSRAEHGYLMCAKEQTKNIPDAEANKPLKPVRPKRRLMPASSVLLRDINIIGFKGESERHTGGKGGRKTAEDENKRTTGSTFLLRLLQKNKSSR